MNRDLFIFIAFCVFMLLLGMRIRQRYQEAKAQKQMKSSERPAPKTKPTDPEMIKMEERRERRIKRFTIMQMVVLFGLIIYMIPALTRDMMLITSIDIPNLFLRLVIFAFAIYIFILSYVKVAKSSHKDEEE